MQENQLNNAINKAKKILNAKTPDNLIERNVEYDQKLPTVSFLIPFYKEYDYLITNINSILKQTYPNIEIIIVNDSPEDKNLHNKIVNLIKDYKYIHLYKNEVNLGGAETMLRCMQHCNSKYAVKIDQDDFYISDTFLEKAVNKLENNPNLSFVAFNTITFLEKENDFHFEKLNYSGFMERKKFLLNFLKKYKKPTSSFPTVFVTKHLKPTTLGMIGDANIYLNLLIYGDAYIFDDLIGVYRFNSSNMTQNLPLNVVYNAILEKHRIYQRANKEYNENFYDFYKFQVLNTLKFYTTANAKFKDIKEIVKWLSENGEISKTIIYTNYIKFKIYKFIVRIYQKHLMK